jgi:hypothetical protein
LAELSTEIFSMKGELDAHAGRDLADREGRARVVAGLRGFLNHDAAVDLDTLLVAFLQADGNADPITHAETGALFERGLIQFA